MQLTRAADYAVRVMIHLAARPGNQRLLLSELSRATAAPESFLSKILQALTRGGLISSRRGHAGGFGILSRGRSASMREVIEAVDGPVCLNLCMLSGLSCERKTWCPAHPVWERAQRALLEVLESTSVAELAAQAPVIQIPLSVIAAPRTQAPPQS
jgi:Rrf2 family protein